MPREKKQPVKRTFDIDDNYRELPVDERMAVESGYSSDEFEDIDPEKTSKRARVVLDEKADDNDVNDSSVWAERATHPSDTPWATFPLLSFDQAEDLRYVCLGPVTSGPAARFAGSDAVLYPSGLFGVDYGVKFSGILLCESFTEMLRHMADRLAFGVRPYDEDGAQLLALLRIDAAYPLEIISWALGSDKTLSFKLPTHRADSCVYRNKTVL